MAQLTFFYDLSSPWTYLAFNNVQEVIAETQATVTWRPFLVGGVFNADAAGGLPTNETTIADELRKAGYATQAIGKVWTLVSFELKSASRRTGSTLDLNGL